MLGRTCTPPELASDLEQSARRFLAGRRQIKGPNDGTLWIADADDWRSFGDQGWFRLLQSERRGGLGLSIRDIGHLLVAGGYELVGGSLADHVIVLPLLCDALEDAVPPELRSALDGQTRIAFADSAAECVAPLRSPTPRLEGDRLLGASAIVPGAPDADVLIVVAVAGEGPAVCVVRRDAPGIGVEHVVTVDESTSCGSVTFDVSAADVLVSLRGAHAAAYLDRTRPTLVAALSCELSGVAEWLGVRTLGYALERRQFDRVIGSFQAIKHILADMSVSATALRNLCISGLAELDEQLVQGESTWLTAAMMKSYAAGAAQRVAQHALQVHGGIGFTEQHPLHRYLKRVLATVGWYGDERLLNARIGLAMVDPTRATSPWDTSCDRACEVVHVQ